MGNGSSVADRMRDAFLCVFAEAKEGEDEYPMVVCSHERKVSVIPQIRVQPTAAEVNAGS